MTRKNGGKKKHAELAVEGQVEINSTGFEPEHARNKEQWINNRTKKCKLEVVIDMHKTRLEATKSISRKSESSGHTLIRVSEMVYTHVSAGIQVIPFSSAGTKCFFI